jgi:hypothetical protein
MSGTPCEREDLEHDDGVRLAGLERVRAALFALTGAFLPFFAFAPFRYHGKLADVSTLLAALFVVVSIPRAARHAGTTLRLWAMAAALVPLLVLLPPRPVPFDPSQYAVSYTHWLLVAGFFCAAVTLRVDDGTRRAVVTLQLVVAALVAGFAVCQAVGDPTVWSFPRSILHPSQRDAFRSQNIGSYWRPTAFFLEPAWLGGYLAWTTVLSAWMATVGAARDRTARAAAGLVSVLCALALAATISWGAYIDGFVCICVFTGLILKRRSFGSRRLAAAGAVVLVLGVPLFLSRPGAVVRDAIRTRVHYLKATPLTGPVGPLDSADSSRQRLDNAIDSLSRFSSHALRGIGLGQLRHPLSGWLAAAAEMGAGGPLVLGGAIAFGFRKARKMRWAGGDRALSIALLLMAAVQALHTGAYLDLAWWFPLSLALVILTERRIDVPGSEVRQETMAECQP